MNEVTIICLLFALTGILFIGLGIPLMLNVVPPNRFYGFRTPRTLRDPKIWYAVNRIQGNDLFLAGALVTISSVIMSFLAQGWSREQIGITLFFIMVFSLIGVALHGLIVLRRM
jgi:uncharacterized membrane protein